MMGWMMGLGLLGWVLVIALLATIVVLLVVILRRTGTHDRRDPHEPNHRPGRDRA